MFRYQSRRRDRWMNLCLGLLLCGILPLGAGAQTPRWTLEDAIESAFTHSPVLQARQTELEEVESGLLSAKTYPYNPELALEVADRSSPGGSTTDRGLSLSQEVELSGQRRKRIAVASEEVASAEAHLLREKRLLAFRVESAFVETVRSRELLAVAETDAALARDVLNFSKRRLERGAATQIEVNLAQASAGRAERSVQRAGAAYASARSALAEIAGVDPSSPPEPVGDLAFPDGEMPALEELLEGAVQNRGDLDSIERQEQAAEAAIRLALAERRPNLVVGGFLQQEEATDDIFGATVGISLPLFNRGRGRIAESRASRERLRYERDAVRLAIEQEVVTALNNLRAARAAAEYLRDQVLGTLEENVDLLQRSFAAGRIGATEVVTLRREFVASRREYVEALADAWLARVELDLATGHVTPPQTPTGKDLP